MIEIIKYILVIFLLDQFLLIVFKKVSSKRQKYITIGCLILIYAVFYKVCIEHIPKNFFETFSAHRIFSAERLKESYHNLKEHHSNMLASKETTEDLSFEEIAFHYETLLNEKTRLVYDKFGPEIIQLTRVEDKKLDPLALFGTYRMGFLIRDGVFYFIFGLIIIAVSSEGKLTGCKNACYSLIVGFYVLEFTFLWPDKPNYDLFDYFFPTYALWQRIYILKGFIGIFCITIKVGFRRRIFKLGDYIEENFAQIQKLQKNLNIQIRSIDPMEILKNCPEHIDFRNELIELSQLMEDNVRMCEENSSEEKKKVNKEGKQKSKPSVIAIILFVLTYCFANK